MLEGMVNKETIKTALKNIRDTCSDAKQIEIIMDNAAYNKGISCSGLCQGTKHQNKLPLAIFTQSQSGLESMEIP